MCACERGKGKEDAEVEKREGKWWWWWWGGAERSQIRRKRRELNMRTHIHTRDKQRDASLSPPFFAIFLHTVERLAFLFFFKIFTFTSAGWATRQRSIRKRRGRQALVAGFSGVRCGGREGGERSWKEKRVKRDKRWEKKAHRQFPPPSTQTQTPQTGTLPHSLTHPTRKLEEKTHENSFCCFVLRHRSGLSSFLHSVLLSPFRFHSPPLPSLLLIFSSRTLPLLCSRVCLRPFVLASGFTITIAGDRSRG